MLERSVTTGRRLSIIVFAQVIDNLKQTPNLVVALLEELESRLADQEMRSMAWKLADEEDGYKVRHLTTD